MIERVRMIDDDLIFEIMCVVPYNLKISSIEDGVEAIKEFGFIHNCPVDEDAKERFMEIYKHFTG